MLAHEKVEHLYLGFMVNWILEVRTEQREHNEHFVLAQ